MTSTTTMTMTATPTAATHRAMSHGRLARGTAVKLPASAFSRVRATLSLVLARVVVTPRLGNEAVGVDRPQAHAGNLRRGLVRLASFIVGPWRGGVSPGARGRCRSGGRLVFGPPVR